MFTKARVELTAWYLSVIMLISSMFSLAIYRVFAMELNRLSERQQMRWERRAPFPELIIDEELLNEAKKRVAINLLLTNGIILVSAGFLGYYLSGKTLAPIERMLEEQYRFISDASHELKTPITAMRTALEVNLRESRRDAKQSEEILRENLEEVIRLQGLAEGLLELTRDERRQPLSKESLLPIVKNGIELMKPLALTKAIKLKFSAETKLYAKVEKESLTRAIVTLIDNAIKFSPKQEVVEIKLRKNGKWIWISVIDKGRGIANNELSKVTERFYRGETSRSSQGYGLGLPIAKKIIESQAGKIQLESKIGKGTTASLLIPYSARLQ